MTKLSNAATVLSFKSIAQRTNSEPCDRLPALPVRSLEEMKQSAYEATAQSFDSRALSSGPIARYYWEKAADFMRAAAVDSISGMLNTHKVSLQLAWQNADLAGNLDNFAAPKS